MLSLEGDIYLHLQSSQGESKTMFSWKRKQNEFGDNLQNKAKEIFMKVHQKETKDLFQSTKLP